MNAKTLIISMFTLVVALLAAASVNANVYGSNDPYSGVQTIGTYYQYTNQIAFNHQQVPAHYYDYAAPARAGGWFGRGSEWITGLRSPMYANVPPVHYTNYYTPTCGNPCWFGGSHGYPRATATAFPPYRERIGGIFSY
jgi:hypothetical protein